MTPNTHIRSEGVCKVFKNVRLKPRKGQKINTEYMKEHYQGTERCRVNKTDTEGDKKLGGVDKMEGGRIRGSFTNQH